MSVLVLAVDGLDFPMLRQLAAEGGLPAIARLFAEGMNAKLVYPPPHSAASHWASVATGTTADQHGICHPLVRRIDGLMVEPATAADLHCAPFWQRAWEAGVIARVAGWPATLGTRLPAAAPPGSCLVADGFAHAERHAWRGWPLAPDAVAPASARAAVRAARVHSEEASPVALASLLEGLPASLEAPARRLLAQWASVHKLGVQWALLSESPLIALRFEGLHDWLAALAAHGAAAPWGLAPLYRCFDGMLGRYLELLPADSHVLLLTETAASGARGPAFDTRVDEHTVTGMNIHTGAHPGADLRLAGLGGFMMSGPNVLQGTRALPVHALDVLPTVLRLLRVDEVTEAIETVSAANIAAALTAPAVHDAVALAWLRQHGCHAADAKGNASLAAMRARAQAVRLEAIVAWAAARGSQGFYADAAHALRRALLLTADTVTRDGLRLLLTQASLNAAAFPLSPLLAAVQSLPHAPPTAAPRPSAPDQVEAPSDPVMADMLAALAAFAERDWPEAETRLQRLVEFAPRPIAALAAGWLGRARLAQGDPAEAERLLAAALQQEAADACIWIAWREACDAQDHTSSADGDDRLALARSILPHNVLLTSPALRCTTSPSTSEKPPRA